MYPYCYFTHTHTHTHTGGMHVIHNIMHVVITVGPNGLCNCSRPSLAPLSVPTSSLASMLLYASLLPLCRSQLSQLLLKSVVHLGGFNPPLPPWEVSEWCQCIGDSDVLQTSWSHDLPMWLWRQCARPPYGSFAQWYPIVGKDWD